MIDPFRFGWMETVRASFEHDAVALVDLAASMVRGIEHPPRHGVDFVQRRGGASPVPPRHALGRIAEPFAISAEDHGMARVA